MVKQTTFSRLPVVSVTSAGKPQKPADLKVELSANKAQHKKLSALYPSLQEEVPWLPFSPPFPGKASLSLPQPKPKQPAGPRSGPSLQPAAGGAALGDSPSANDYLLERGRRARPLRLSWGSEEPSLLCSTSVPCRGAQLHPQQPPDASEGKRRWFGENPMAAFL